LAWTIELSRSAERQLKKLDRTWQMRVVGHLRMISALENPRLRGKALQSDLAGLWRYRIGDYRIICEIHDDRLVIRAITIGHRSSVYD
jgi:mRNA interferase RelE/StbE